MSVPGEGAFTNPRAHLSSLHAPLNRITGAFPETKDISSSELPAYFAASGSIVDFRRLEVKDQE